MVNNLVKGLVTKKQLVQLSEQPKVMVGVTKDAHRVNVAGLRKAFLCYTAKLNSVCGQILCS